MDSVAAFSVAGATETQEIVASVLFVLASITDGLDGYLARKRGQITTMGMLLDPLADKIMVTAAFVALVAYNPEVVKVWIVVVIIGREFLISGLRSIAASEGFTITASELGKLKTVVQIVSVVSAILAHRWDHWQIGVDCDSSEMVRDCRHLLRGSGCGDFGGRLFHRLLEEDRPRFKGSPQGRCAFARQEREDIVNRDTWTVVHRRFRTRARFTVHDSQLTVPPYSASRPTHAAEKSTARRPWSDRC